MNKVIRKPRALKGRIEVPADKSLTHRAIFLSSLAEGISTISNPLLAEDCLSTAACVEQLGCHIEKKKGAWTLHGQGLWGYSSPVGALNCGNSGTTMRLISGLLAAQDFKSNLVGDDSLSKRPMDRVSRPLEQMGARFTLRDGKFAPFQIQGTKKLKPINWTNLVASAQVKSAVLLAGIHAEGETTFEEPALSRDHTERMLAACGVKVTRRGKRVSVEGPAPLKPQNWKIPGDFSSAAFFIAAGLLAAADLSLEKVNLNPTRIGLLPVLAQMGARLEIKSGEAAGEPIGDFHVKGPQTLKAITISGEVSAHMIDEAPILAVLATQAHGTTILEGFEDLRVKETDRIVAMAKNLQALGANIEERADGLVIQGPSRLKGASVDSFGDHRVAMASAIAGLIADGETEIRNSDCVAISFPTFWDLLDSLNS